MWIRQLGSSRSLAWRRRLCSCRSTGWTGPRARQYATAGAAGPAVQKGNDFLKVSEEVEEALYARRPVVALETTIYTHGFPYPDNVALASELESIVRVNGGVPATIGILDGVARVGLSPEELIRLASAAGKEDTLKISRRDLSYACGLRLTDKKYNGGTTIAGTMILAHLAGIKVFATGGLGGVHRGGESSMDISADLTELGRTPVAVISSGCKSFLDVQRTLEYLETEGVTVATFADGRDGKVDFPAFFTRESGVKSPMVIRDEKEAAAIIDAHLSIPLTSGLHFANPIPAEHSIALAEMESITQQAIKEAEASGVMGKDNTPFILAKIKELTGGKSVPANRALIAANVKRGVRVASEFENMQSIYSGRDYSSQLKRSLSRTPEKPEYQRSAATASKLAQPANTKATTTSPSQSTDPVPEPVGEIDQADVVVAGALAVDLSCDFVPMSSSLTVPQSPQLHTSNPAVITPTLGGVAHNIARAAHVLGTSVRLCSAVGNDFSGRAALARLSAAGISTAGIKTLDASTEQRTAQYVSVNDANKNLVLAMADMGILEYPMGNFATAWAAQVHAAKPKWLVADANWNYATLHAWLRAGKAAGARTAFEPVSRAKSTRLFKSVSFSLRDATDKIEEQPLPVFPSHLVDVAAPNIMELASMHATARAAGLFDRDDWWAVINALNMPSSGSTQKLARATSTQLTEDGVPQQCIQLLPFMPCIATKLGPNGVLLTMLLRWNDARLSDPEAAPYIIARASGDDDEIGGVYMRLFPASDSVDDDEVVSVNGVGDTFLGALIAGLVQTRQGIETCVDGAQRAAVMSLKSRESVSAELGRFKENFNGLARSLED